MKKISLLLTAVILIGCQESVEDICLSKDTSFVAIVEGFGDNTKTSMGTMNNIVWSEEDQLAIFQGCSMADKYQVKDESVGTGNGTFMLVSDNSSEVNDDFNSGIEIATNIAIYPYSENLSVTNATVSVDDGNSRVSAYEITGFELPSVQQYVPDSFGSNTFPMVAVTESLSDHSLKFKNVLGAIKLQLKGSKKIKSIKIESKNGEKLSGPVTIIAYPDTFAPAIIMSEEASTSVLLDCGEGVQLSESVAKEFIITLPPVLLISGFKVIVTDVEGVAQILETSLANTILRSSVLIMPILKIGDVVCEEGSEESEEHIPVGMISLDYKNLTIAPKMTYTFVTKVVPLDAADKALTWNSSASNIVTVDQMGKITAISEGDATITVLTKNGVSNSCKVTVLASIEKTKEYVEDGINYGYGIAIGDNVWAPVNCGYEAPKYDSNGNVTDKGYPYGKLYQWGRKYGQGYSKEFDSMDPIISEGPVSYITGQKEENANTFYTSTDEFFSDWLSPLDDYLWNSSVEEYPVKTVNDPCPAGWRIPTYNELDNLRINSFSDINEYGQKGRFFSGEYSLIEGCPKLWLPASGFRSSFGETIYRDVEGSYWSSSPLRLDSIYISLLYFSSSYVEMNDTGYAGGRAFAHSVRCVQE